MRIGVGQRAFQALAAEHHDEAMSLAGFDDDLRVADFLHLRRKHRAQLLARFGRDAPGAAVGDDALGVKRGEVGARATSPALSSKPEPERFDDAAADLKFQRVVAEQPEMARPAAGSDARARRESCGPARNSWRARPGSASPRLRAESDRPVRVVARSPRPSSTTSASLALVFSVSSE